MRSLLSRFRLIMPLWREVRYVLIPVVVLLSVLFPLLLLHALGLAPVLDTPIPRRVGGWVVAMCYGATAIVVARMLLGVRRLKRLARRGGFKLCLNCAYCLRGLPDEGVCPECGKPYDVVKAMNLWRNWVEGRTRPRSPEEREKRLQGPEGCHRSSQARPDEEGDKTGG